ncbi:3'(2'),5'-bisphosphate nucleotidase CysQ [Shewanella cyperi]|uniref:3'(2'),5'-bisphosphate nucleotidase CysQ n=1 Tax=Shewanella cyperi TaxID=2814292 RepID=UPI001A94B4B2|nr:3'(2'),5'-bisphosphate nucleotidase CysQ [Shewanella cyperi]QSX39635.1 3'(2'),5'-bisphosphate nucleotidase CysQ [Shewanella cyperi]
MTIITIGPELLDNLADMARRAGDAILAIYGREQFDVALKSDDSPVTAADLASHAVIMSALSERYPGVPVLSEEAEVPWTVRQGWQEYWLVDPLDGTKEFIKRNGEFTVNIALIRQGQAVAGVVYAPCFGGEEGQGACYVGAKGLGAWLRVPGEQARPLTGAEHVRPVPLVVGSRSHGSPGLEAYLAELGEHELLSVGSSLKFCMLAEGRADLYPRLGPTSEWDTAAAQAVLEAAGGKVLEYESRQPLRYNQKESLLNPWFLALAPGQGTE